MTAAAASLSIVIPAFNEEDRLAATLDSISEWRARRSGTVEVIVVDDGSSDATSRIAAEFSDRGVRLLRLERNRGKGAAVREGVAASRGDEVLVSDADLSTPIREVERLEHHLRQADLVLGSRASGEARITRHQPRFRELAGKSFNALIRMLGVRGIRDTQCGFKLIRGRVARELFALLTIDRYAFDVELVWLARGAGYRVVEVGVEWRNDPASRVHVVRDGCRMLLDVMRMRWSRRSRGS